MLEKEERMNSSQYISLIEEQANGLQKQDEYDYTLNYNNLYKEEKEKINKFKKLWISIKSSVSVVAWAWQKSFNEEVTLRRDRWIKSLKSDFYIDEATNILQDLNSKDYNGLAHLKINKD